METKLEEPSSNGSDDGHGFGDEDGPKETKEFIHAKGFTSAEADVLLEKYGRNELEEKHIPKWLVFLKLLWGPMPIVIWIAIIIEAALTNWPDFAILLAIQFINAGIGWYESTKAADAVAALKASLKPRATVKRDGKFQTIDAAVLVPGDLVLLGAGSAVPADCLVNEGQIEVDQAALTGESLPVTMFTGDSAKMGSTVTRGEVEATVEFTGKDTFFGKTASMLQQDNELGNLQKILLKIMFILVALSVLLCVICLIYMWLETDNAREALTFAVVVLVASIPLAIEIVTTATLALGSRELSVRGAIVTRLMAIEELAGMNMLCSDKTGTLTLNKMVIQDDTPVFSPGEDQSSVLLWGALAAKWNEPPRDALDTLVLNAVDIPECDKYEQIAFVPFDPTVKRTEGTLRRDGKVFKTTKGAPHIILKLIHERETIEKAVEYKVNELGKRGIRSLAVAKTDDDGHWRMMGILTFLDPPRPDTKITLERAMEFGVDVKMITGDHSVIARETSRQLGLGTNICGADDLPSLPEDGSIPKDLGEKYGEMILKADGFAQVYPEHKYLIVEALRQSGFSVGMTGDGVNDAPALKRADCGIAVQGATDAARAAADIVLTNPGLSVVVEGIVIARCIFKRVQAFFNYRIAATIQIVCFFFISTFAFRPIKWAPEGMEELPHEDAERWPEFFTLPVLLLLLITVLNDGTLITIAYDHVNPSPRPEKWNLPILFIQSIVLATVALGSSLLLLWAMLSAHNENSLLHRMGLPEPSYGQIVMAMYLKISLSDFFTLFASRTNGFFFTQRPGIGLVCGFTFAVGLSTLLACMWPKMIFDNVQVEGLTEGEYKLWPLWVWIFCIIFFLVQDLTKVITYQILFATNAFHINTAMLINKRDAFTTKGKNAALARASMCIVDEKLVGMKVENAIEAVERASSLSGSDKGLQRVSKTLALARQSLQVIHEKHGDLEAGGSNMKTVVEELHTAAAGLDRTSQQMLASTLDDVDKAAAKLKESTNARDA